VASDLARLIEIMQVTLLGDAWERAEIGAVVFNDARRFLAANPAYCTLTGYSREEITDLRAGHNLLLEEMSQAEFIDRITQRHHLGQAVIRQKDGTPRPVSYMLVRTQVSQLPCYVGLVWPQGSPAQTGPPSQLGVHSRTLAQATAFTSSGRSGLPQMGDCPDSPLGLSIA
jgi:PAS domain S-box-containing protein